MAEWAPKRFWTAAEAVAVEGGHAVHLDGRAVRTPARAAFVLPSRALAEAAAAEWAAQGDKVDPATMPVTRAANSAIDTIGANRAAVQEMIAAYGGSDLLCYRAEAPAELVARQAEGWDPLLAWLAATHGAPLAVTAGIVPVDQPADSLARLDAALGAVSDFELAALHDLVALSGSLVIGLAAAAGRHPPEHLWALSRLDETFQAEQWGRDDEAEAVAEIRRAAFLDAARFLTLVRATK
ncbi:ATP12 family chaperone protein [Frigidibacter sp. MR17.24]|uniref:ATP12 family chaperone protein n=1 Tax=Frigidibacter sp. MR17.24 TaxID=3127345 RepID=UPI0030130066